MVLHLLRGIGVQGGDEDIRQRMGPRRGLPIPLPPPPFPVPPSGAFLGKSAHNRAVVPCGPYGPYPDVIVVPEARVREHCGTEQGALQVPQGSPSQQGTVALQASATGQITQ